MAISSSKIYGNVKVQHGRKLQYLGMDLNCTTPGEVKISMVPCIDNILNDFPEEIVEIVATSAADHLSEVQDNVNAKNT